MGTWLCRGESHVCSGFTVQRYQRGCGKKKDWAHDVNGWISAVGRANAQVDTCGTIPKAYLASWYSLLDICPGELYPSMGFVIACGLPLVTTPLTLKVDVYSHEYAAHYLNRHASHLRDTCVTLA